MRSDYETLSVTEPAPGVRVVTLNRPDSLNAMNTRMLKDLLDLFTGLYVDPGAARCVVLTGAGGRAFCSGGDLKERNGMTDDDWRRQHALGEQAFRAVSDCPAPILAAVNGVAYGGGCELMLLADFAYAARSARFALPEVTRGIMPGAMGTQTLPRACGTRRAKEVVLTGQPFTAEEALAWGVVNRVCDDDALLTEALATARRIAENAPLAVRQAKKSLDVATQTDLRTGYAFELEAYNRLVPTEDRQEGVRAFVEGRKPNFQGR